MAQLSSVATLNGVDPFDLTGFGQSYVWGSNGFLHSVDLYDNDPANSHTIDLSLSGANWVLREMSIGGNSARQISISDLDGGSQRNIELMQFFGGNAQISLQSTNIGTINAYDGAFDFALGSGFFGLVNIGNASSSQVSNLPGSNINMLRISGPADGSANNDIEIGGRAGYVRIWKGDNQIAATGRIAQRMIAPQIIANAAAFEAGERMPTEVDVERGY